MVTLLIGLSIAAILMTATMPAWHQLARREKEAELIFRLGQYSRAIRLFQSRNGPGVLPPSIDLLVEQKHLRKKFKDPITGEDFEAVTALTQTAIGPPGSGRGGTAAPGAPGSGTSTGRGGGPPVSSFGRGTQQGGAAPGGLRGVVSSSEAESLRVLNGRTHYNEWVSTEVPDSTFPRGASGATAPGTSVPGTLPGGAGGRGGAPGGGQRGTGGLPGGGRGQSFPGGGGASSPFGPGQGGSTMPLPGGRR